MASVRRLTDLTVPDLWKRDKDEATLWGTRSCEMRCTVKLRALRARTGCTTS